MKFFPRRSLFVLVLFFGTLGSFEFFQHKVLEQARFGFQAQALFTPDDQVKDFLLGLIEAESTRIEVAAFRCTDPDFAQALIEAHSRGVVVTVVADVGCLGHRSSKLRKFKQEGITVYTYPAIDAPKSYSLMHNKYVLFHELGYVWTGSMNFTTAAMNANQENVLILRSSELLQDYTAQFQVLIERSTEF